MQTRQLGPSDVKITPITMGAWAIGGWMWGSQDESDAIDAIETSIANGVTSIDTAPAYGFGASEELIGRVIKDRRDEVQILTKYGLRWDIERGEKFVETTDGQGNPVTIYRCSKQYDVIEECERSLKRLQTDFIDLYQCHWRDHTTPVEETMEAMDKLIKAGKIRAAGVSNFSVEEIDAARKVVPLASDQPKYSMLSRGIEAELVPYCRANHVALVVYSPMERGLLTGKVTMDREFEEGDNRSDAKLFQPDNRRKVLDFLHTTIKPIADAHDATIAQVVINWTYHQPGITAALVGARNRKQAEQNAKAAGFELTDTQQEQIAQGLNRLELDR